MSTKRLFIRETTSSQLLVNIINLHTLFMYAIIYSFSSQPEKFYVLTTH